MKTYILNIIQFCNDNDGFISAIASISSIVLSFIAIVISIKVAKKQNSISLLEQRIKMLDSIEAFCKSLYNWEFDLSRHKKIGKSQIVALFNKKAYEQYQKIYSYGETINNLYGDLEFAKRHDTCNDRTMDDIQKEIFDNAENCEKIFGELKETIFEKYIRI